MSGWSYLSKLAKAAENALLGGTAMLRLCRFISINCGKVLVGMRLHRKCTVCS
jgi:hypothetical protein